MNAHREPIVANLLTGFLGAGKTSLLNRLLSNPALADTAVVINEFGAIGLDHLLVEAVDDGIVLLKSGCICCTIRGDLKEAILILFERRSRGEVPMFSRLVIETTGLADPAPIIATLSSDLMLKYHFRMGNIITVVDVPNGKCNIASYVESARQVAVADRIVITKSDLADRPALAELKVALKAANPTADIVLLEEVLDSQEALLIVDVHDLAARSAEVARWIPAQGHAMPHLHDHAHDVNRHGNIRAIVIDAEQPVEWSRFAIWLSMLIHRHGQRLLRLKGFVYVAGVETPLSCTVSNTSFTVRCIWRAGRTEKKRQDLS